MSLNSSFSNSDWEVGQVALILGPPLKAGVRWWWNHLMAAPRLHNINLLSQDFFPKHWTYQATGYTSMQCSDWPMYTYMRCLKLLCTLALGEYFYNKRTVKYITFPSSFQGKMSQQRNYILMKDTSGHKRLIWKYNVRRKVLSSKCVTYGTFINLKPTSKGRTKLWIVGKRSTFVNTCRIVYKF